MLSCVFHIRHNQCARALYCISLLHNKQRCTIEKRAEKLMKLIKTNEKRKHWHLQIGATGSPEKSIYDKVPRPHKRARVLNSLFMESITDVLSTGDVCPEVMGYGIEITGVRITSDYQIVNVFWQTPNIKEAYNVDIEIMLAKSAPNIRGELIRRNILGKVPRIYFIRDPTNKRASEFQKCIEVSGVSEIKDPPSLPAEELLKNIYKFTEERDEKLKKSVVEEEPKKPEVLAQSPVPVTPPDMKRDVMGLDHEMIFKKVLKARKSTELRETVLPIAPRVTGGGEKFEKQKIIEADPLFDSTEREKQMKKFCIDQKSKWAKIQKCNMETATYNMMESDTTDDTTEDFEEDYFEEEDVEEENKDMSHTPLR